MSTDIDHLLGTILDSGKIDDIIAAMNSITDCSDDVKEQIINLGTLLHLMEWEIKHGRP